jgi:beta-lactamase regulating signal transducer with metallopeptidase domain
MTLLVEWIWQGSALACTLWVVLRCAPWINAATRYALWWVALLVVLILPIVTQLAMFGSGMMEPAGAGGTSPALDVAPEGGPLVELPMPPDWLIACGIGAWLGSVLLGFGRLVRGLVTVRQLKRRSRRVAVAVERSLVLRRQWRPGGRRRAALRVSSSVSGACALGLLGRPVIVLSDRLVARLDPDDLDLIVLHEQVHLARGDDWATLVQSCVSIFVGWHPAVRVISAALDAEREAACDDAVAARIGNVARYATCLADAADIIAARGLTPARAMAPHAAGAGSLLVRVQRLLDPHVRRRTGLQRVVLGSGVAGLAAASMIAIVIGPLVGAAETPLEPLTRRSAVNAVTTLADARAVARATHVESAETLDQPVVDDQSLRRPAIATRPRAGRPVRLATPVLPVTGPPPPSTATTAIRTAPSEAVPLATATVVAGEAIPLPIEARVLAATPVALPVARNAASEAEPAGWAAMGRRIAEEGAAVGQELAQRSTVFGRQVAPRSSAVGGFFGRAGKAVAGQF